MNEFEGQEKKEEKDPREILQKTSGLWKTENIPGHNS